MSESNRVRDTQPMQSAGEMLRAARQAQGLHIAALATQLKVTPRKLELLESDQHAELQGQTFVRALAQAACRALKIDPAPVLARLPDADGNTLDQVNGGLNAPFREHGARRAAMELPQIRPLVLVLVGLLLAAAAALWLVPHDWSLPELWHKAAAPLTTQPSAAGASASMGNLTTEAVSPMPAGSAVVETVPGAMAPGQLLQVRATRESWVEVTDSGGLSVLSRLLQPGETVDLDGNPPLRVKIGNAAGTELSFRGQLVDLAPSTRDNVARLELK